MPIVRCLFLCCVALTHACAARPSPAAGAPAEKSPWPGRNQAAVSLTYDDGLDTQLAVAAPQLDQVGLKGTFFLSSMAGVDHDWALPNASRELTPRQRAWQAVARGGHELASHSVNHPCPLELHAGQAEGFRLSDYDSTRMAQELDESLRRLARLGARPPLSFAYPCESDRFGLGEAHTDYSPLVRERFAAVRGSRAGMADPRSVSLTDVPLIDTQGMSADALRALVGAAREKGAWLVLLFHGVGEATSCPDLSYRPEDCMLNYLVTSADAHRELVSYLASERGTVWTAPFGEVARHLKTVRGQ